MDNNFNRTTKQKILDYLICFIVAFIIVFIFAILRGVFVSSNSNQVYKILSDSCFVTGVIFSGYGLLVVASNGGTFDMLVYGFKLAISSMFRDPSRRKSAKTFYEYRLAKSENKRSFIYLVIVGAVFILLALLFNYIYLEYFY